MCPIRTQCDDASGIFKLGYLDFKDSCPFVLNEQFIMKHNARWAAGCLA